MTNYKNGVDRKANNRVGINLNLFIMNKNEEFKIEELETRLEMACQWVNGKPAEGFECSRQ